MAKLLTVFGATGQQGGALKNYVLQHKELSKLFTLRGVTRNVSQPTALALAEKGVQMVQANLNDPQSVEKAVSESYAVFGVTNFWEEASAAVEIAQGKTIADASVKAGVTQLIWSSLPSVTLMTQGKVTGIEHFDSKAKVETYIRGLDIKSLFFMPGWFMQNQLSIFRPKLDTESAYVFAIPFAPSSLIPLIDIRDAGKFLLPALLDPELYNGKIFTCATAFYTPVEMVETWTKVTGKTVKLNASSRDSVSQEVQNDFDQMVKYGGYFGETGQKDLEWTLGHVSEELRTWEEFVQDNEPWF